MGLRQEHWSAAPKTAHPASGTLRRPVPSPRGRGQGEGCIGAWRRSAAVGWLVVVLLAIAAAPAAANPPPAPKLASLIGQAAPDFTLPTAAGPKVKLADFKGCVVIVDFWTTSCPPCIAVLQHFQQLSDDQGRHGKGLRVLAINFGEPASRVAAFLKKNHFTLTVPLDAQGTVAQSYRVADIPHTVLIGRDGTVQQTFLGFDEKTPKEIDQAVDQALDEKKQ